MITTILAAAAAVIPCPNTPRAQPSECAVVEYAAEDAVLSSAVAMYDPMPELTRAQRAWQAYRDAHCRWANGTMNRMGETMCKIELTRERINQLTR